VLAKKKILKLLDGSTFLVSVLERQLQMTDNQDPVNPERIVSLSPSNTEILFAVGAGNRVVGVTDHCNYPEALERQIETKKTIRVGGYWDPSVDAITSLKPDLVLVSAHQCTVKTNYCQTSCSRRCEQTTKVAKKLESLGFNVLILSPHSLDDVVAQVLLVGDATGNVAEARVLVNNMKQRIDAVATNSSKMSEKPKVYFEVWNNPYISVNSKTWIGNLISLAGGTNVFEDSVTEWPILQPQEIIKRNPDIMVFPVIPGVPRFWGSFESVKKRQGWQNVNAIQNGRLYELPRDFISRPGPRLVDGLELLGTMIDPQ
jgi:iron complex transport system substrate-binding protein